ncbi:NDMA-dependent alcohol dehydrogenase [Nocardia vaccinii]|uniref:NDMA-dependent alcohol dehydrogenase n=1 Tax=Nocardia vaccinii TaxID=1822 RepID=UPI0008325D95|nr:NDMA-dependent alcohol dehydrogenase [Nocardia vaccinii]
MKTKAAVIHEVGKAIEIEELDLNGPGAGEVLVRYTHAGLCHSDVHLKHGDLPARLPMVLGHEGAGIVEDVGIGVTRVKPADHIVCSFIPTCGKCHWCATGQQAICDMGATILEGSLPGERWPLTGPRGQYGAMCMLGTFSQYGVIHETSAVPIRGDLPLEQAALVGCGVPTGWGSAVNVAGVRPGDTVIIYGVGGIGMNAVQGARSVGATNIIVVDPIQWKREKATSVFGATHAVEKAEDAQQLAIDLTYGVGATSAIITVGVADSEVVEQAFRAISKGGTIVVTAVGKFGENTVVLPSAELTLFRKTVKGTVFGDCNPTSDIPQILDMYQGGRLKLDELITERFALEQVDEAYDRLLAGEILRGVIVHEH